MTSEVTRTPKGDREMAAATKAPKTVFRSTLALSAYEAACDRLVPLLRFAEGMRQDWREENPGCTNCRGIGYKVTASYMSDYGPGIYEERETCKACNGATQTVPQFTTPELEAAEAECDRLNEEHCRIVAIERNPKGRRVEVYKGRKVPVGTTGKVFWCGQNRFGTSVGLIVDGTGEKVFTAHDNVNVIDW